MEEIAQEVKPQVKPQVKPEPVRFAPHGQQTATIATQGIVPFDITFKVPSRRSLRDLVKDMDGSAQDVLLNLEDRQTEDSTVDLTDKEALVYDDYCSRVIQKHLQSWTLPVPCTADSIDAIEQYKVIGAIFKKIMEVSATVKNS